MSHFIKCTDGKERQIFPAKIKDKDKIRHFSAQFASTAPIVNIIAIDDENNEQSEEGLKFNDAPYNAMMEILILAFGEKYSQQEIEQFLDVEMIDEILEVFYGISGYKKKAKQKEMPIGMS